MPEHNKENHKRDIPPGNDPVYIHGPLTDAERHEEERRKYQQERDRNEDAYKTRQVAIEEGQLRTNRKIASYTLILAMLTAGGTVVSFLSSQAAKESANAAKSAAETADKTLREIKAGGADTHDLAVASGKQADRMKDFADRMKDQAERTKVIAGQAIIQAQIARVAAQAATSAAKTASDQLVLGERTWIKIKHRIVSPLRFNVGGRASGKDVALITIEDTLENIGQSVAMNVFSWEDIVPLDPDFTYRTAQVRQVQWCEDNRHREPKTMTGYTLFPHEPMIQQSVVGPTMETIAQAAANAPKSLDGKVGFVLVGCVIYRSSFEAQNNSAHETRFLYYLGAIGQGPAFNPYVMPTGIATSLRLVTIPDGFSAN